jgi:hypothetical protein
MLRWQAELTNGRMRWPSAGSPGMAVRWSVFQRSMPSDFDPRVDTGSRQENASNQKLEPRSDSIGTEKALASRVQQPLALRPDHGVTFAGRPSQTVDIPDFDLPPAITDESRLLKSVRHD